MARGISQLRDAAAVALIVCVVSGAVGVGETAQMVGSGAAFAGCLIGRWIG